MRRTCQSTSRPSNPKQSSMIKCQLTLILYVLLLRPHREYPDEKDLSKYQLALHCGGCMIDPQKMRARISDMEEAGIPVTNYGLFLSYVHSPHALARALEPWGLTLPL